MKIIAILNNRLGAGGGFDQALNAILQMQRLSEGRFAFEVLTGHDENLPILEQLGLRAHHGRFGLWDRILIRLNRNDFWCDLQRHLKLLGSVERRLRRLGCDLAYYVTPDSGSAALQTLPFITTVWDLCHRDHPEFPEVRDFNELAIRETQLRSMLAGASLVLCDAAATVQALQRRYGCDPDKLLAMPFAPSPMLGPQSDTVAAVRQQYDLNEPYFFYPAQFWAHKNHIRIIQALQQLKKDAWKPVVVFSGRDHGNLAYIKDSAAEAGVAEQVRFLGFVPSAHMRGLYEGALAVLMPTYFGPTNLPPLEAWSLGVPLVYSAHLADQAGEAALLADPDDAVQWADAMRACSDPEIRRRLVEAGRLQLQAVGEQRSEAERVLLRRLSALAMRRTCWG